MYVRLGLGAAKSEDELLFNYYYNENIGRSHSTGQHRVALNLSCKKVNGLVSNRVSIDELLLGLADSF